MNGRLEEPWKTVICGDNLEKIESHVCDITTYIPFYNFNNIENIFRQVIYNTITKILHFPDVQVSITLLSSSHLRY